MLNLDSITLREQTELLRRLARGILDEDDAADEVVQETWLTALRKGGSEAAQEIGWLRGIARHVALRHARAKARRAAREAQARQVDRTRSPRELDVLRELLDELETLREPYRDALIRRYLHGIPPRSIARETQVPLATVKSRLKRGLAELRARLDDRGNRDGSWRTVLLPLGTPASWQSSALGAAALTGVSIMKAKVAIGVVLALIAIGAWQLGRHEPGEKAQPAATLPSVATEIPGSVPDAQSRKPIATTPFSPPPPARVSRKPEAVLGDGEWGVRGHVRFRGGEPVAGARLSLGMQSYVSKGTADDDGAFEIVLGAESVATSAFLQFDGNRITLDEVPIRPGDDQGPWLVWDVTVPDPVLVCGRVADTAGNPVLGIGVRLWRVGSASQMALSGANGRFEFLAPLEGTFTIEVVPRLDPGSSARDDVSIAGVCKATLTREGVPADQHRSAFRPLPRAATRDQELWPQETLRTVSLVTRERVDLGTLVVAPLGTIVFRVLDGSGETAPGKHVSVICPVRRKIILSAASDATGEARLEYPSGNQTIRPEVRGFWIEEPEEAREGLPVPVPPSGEVQVTLKFGPHPLAALLRPGARVSVAVVDSYHEPVPGARVTWGPQSGTTDATGRVTLNSNPTLKATLSVEAEGFRTHERRDHTVTSWDQIVLEPAASATLIIAGSDGEMVHDVRTFTLQELSYPSGHRVLGCFGQLERRQSRDGCYPIPPVRPGSRFGRVALWTRTRGFGSVDLRPGLPAGATREVRLRATSEIEGVVLTPEGDPAPGVRIYSGAADFPIDLRIGGDETPESLTGSRCIGGTTSGPGGRFKLRGPARNGVLCLLHADIGGTIVDYPSAAGLATVHLHARPEVTVRRARKSPVEQGILLELLHPSVRLKTRSLWPAGDLSTTLRAPLRGPFLINHHKMPTPEGKWVGLSATGTVEVTADRAEASVKE